MKQKNKMFVLRFNTTDTELGFKLPHNDEILIMMVIISQQSGLHPRRDDKQGLNVSWLTRKNNKQRQTLKVDDRKINNPMFI